MGIFDKILGKEEEKPVAPKKTEKVQSEKKKEAAKEVKPARIATKSVAGGKPVAKVQAEKPKKKVSSRKMTKKEDSIAHRIIFEAIVSEKSTELGSSNKYVFKVDQKAGKFQIKEAVEGYYGVQVTKVNTIRISPKKRIHGRTVGYKQGFKKAVVTLRQGDTIAMAEGV